MSTAGRAGVKKPGTASKTTAKGTAKGTAKDKDAVPSAADEKKAKQMHDFKYNSDEAKQMRTEIRSMIAEIENEARLLNEFQQQKAKIDQFHDLSKQKREELKMELRNALRQKQDLEEKQAFELKIYKQKVKHLLQEQQSSMSSLRIQHEEKLHQVEVGQRADQHELSKDTRGYKVALKNAENTHWDFLKHLKVEQEQSILALRQEYERRHSELRNEYDKKQKVLRAEQDEKRKEEIQRLEMKKNTHIADLMSKHKRKFDKIKKYYSDITHANLELIKNLKEEVGDMKKKEAAVQKEVADIKRINKKLSKPLQANRELVQTLQQDLQQYKRDKMDLIEVQNALQRLEERCKNIEWEIEIGEQKMIQCREERDTLQKKLSETIYSVQQKTGFKNLLLEKKLSAMTQDLEKTESALAEVLASTNLHPDIIGDLQHNLEDVLMAKNRTTQRLEDHLQELKRKYARTIQRYEAKMAEFQIPVEELGFTATRKL